MHGHLNVLNVWPNLHILAFNLNLDLKSLMLSSSPLLQLVELVPLNGDIHPGESVPLDLVHHNLWVRCLDVVIYLA